MPHDTIWYVLTSYFLLLHGKLDSHSTWSTWMVRTYSKNSMGRFVEFVLLNNYRKKYWNDFTNKNLIQISYKIKKKEIQNNSNQLSHLHVHENNQLQHGSLANEGDISCQTKNSPMQWIVLKTIICMLCVYALLQFCVLRIWFLWVKFPT